MLDISTFRSVVNNAPLVSIDLCIICDGQILLGHRNNEPLKGAWFTPGGRILKNEAYFDCLRRVARSELGLTDEDAKQARLMGIWDHFYNNSAFSETITTYYVNLPHYICIEKKPNLIGEEYGELHSPIISSIDYKSSESVLLNFGSIGYNLEFISNTERGPAWKDPQPNYGSVIQEYDFSENLLLDIRFSGSPSEGPIVGLDPGLYRVRYATVYPK